MEKPVSLAPRYAQVNAQAVRRTLTLKADHGHRAAIALAITEVMPEPRADAAEMRKKEVFVLKRIVLTIAVLALALSLCGCVELGPQATQTATTAPVNTAAPTAEQTAEPTDVPTAEPTAQPTAAPVNAEDAAALTELLTGISTDYHIGTAGSSLISAKCAAMLLDWDSAADMSAEHITAVTADFFAALDADHAAEFPAQLDGVFSASDRLFTDSALDMLDSVGYEPAAYPWAQEDCDALFAALYAGIGAEMPQ